MNLSRRKLLAASLGLGQCALLDRHGLLREAKAGGDPSRPSRLLVLFLDGGSRFSTFFVPPASPAEVATFILPPIGDYHQEPCSFDAQSLVELGPAAGGFDPLRIGRTWNPGDPKDRAGYTKTPAGYGWVNFPLASRTTVLHGIDQGTFAHNSAYVSALCGAPGAAYRAPAFVSLVANHLYKVHGNARPLPCVAIRATNLPIALDLPPVAAPVVIASFDGLASYFSADPVRNAWWKDHDVRTDTSIPGFSGGDPTTVAATRLERFAMERVRKLRGRSTAGTDAYLERLHEGYVATSSTLARNVVDILEKTKGAEGPKPDYAASYSPFGVTFGNANGGPDINDAATRILRLLKSDLTSVVHAYLSEVGYDTHNGLLGTRAGVTNLRGQLDAIARLMGEMQGTPAPGKPGKSLWDDTLVVIMSEFGRTWSRGPDQSSFEGWYLPDDHFNLTSVILSGGNAGPNRQIGGFDLGDQITARQVAIREETGSIATRAPRSADVVATICDAFGMTMGTDFFIPGGYGVIQGATV